MTTMTVKPLLCIALLSIATPTLAENPADSIAADTTDIETLQTVTIEAAMQSTDAGKSTFIPTKRQRNAAQNATDLLSRLNIPQLEIPYGSTSVKTVSGQDVAVFIDYIPATSDELAMMRVDDVLRVEYLQSPSDPRFGGKTNVVNFVMRHYEYGGYVRTQLSENFIANSGQAQINGRFNYRRMTYDIMGYGYYAANDHTGTAENETFRLPDGLGGTNIIERQTTSIGSKFRRNDFNVAFRARYAGDKLTANNILQFNNTRMPHRDSQGAVTYSTDLFDNSTYTSEYDSHTQNATYTGYFNLSFDENNSLTIRPVYSYTRTTQDNTYSEAALSPIIYGARDYTNLANITLNYGHSFDKKNSITLYAYGRYEHNHTQYTGNTDVLDRTTSFNGNFDAGYTFNNDTFSSTVRLGWSYTHTDLNGIVTNYSTPYADAFLQYAFSRKSSANAYFHYAVWPPSSNYKSNNVIQTSPLMWITGNPALKSTRSYDAGIQYTYMPSNTWRFSAFGYLWAVGNRSAFDYTASANGILRTITQPAGSFGNYNFGVNVSWRPLGGKLDISGRLTETIHHNGSPYDIDRSCLTGYIQAMYYFGNFNIVAAYVSRNNYGDDSMSGFYTRSRDAFALAAGWGNSTWNVNLLVQNIFRWDWRQSSSEMRSPYYDVNRQSYGVDNHALVQAKVTYTFSFGKKTHSEDDINTGTTRSASGILR